MFTERSERVRAHAARPALPQGPRCRRTYCAMTSRPLIICLMARCWIADGFSNPVKKNRKTELQPPGDRVTSTHCELLGTQADLFDPPPPLPPTPMSTVLSSQETAAERTGRKRIFTPTDMGPYLYKVSVNGPSCRIQGSWSGLKQTKRSR